MHEPKRFAITVARRAWPSVPSVIVVHIPWDQYGAPGGPAAYARIIEKTGAAAVVASKGPDGRWESTTNIGDVWKGIREATPLASMEWHTMAIESDHYPWERFGGGR